MNFLELVGVLAMVACSNVGYLAGHSGGVIAESYGSGGFLAGSASVAAVAAPAPVAVKVHVPRDNVRILYPPIDLTPKLLREHVTIHRTVKVPVPKPIAIPVPHDVPYPVPQITPVLVDRPYKIPVGIPQPVKVDSPVQVPYERPVAVPVPHPVGIPVGVPKPVVVGVPTPVAVPQVVVNPVFHAPPPFVSAVAPAPAAAVVKAHHYF